MPLTFQVHSCWIEYCSLLKNTHDYNFQAMWQSSTDRDNISMNQQYNISLEHSSLQVPKIVTFPVEDENYNVTVGCIKDGHT